jgi:hypothetical protein
MTSLYRFYSTLLFVKFKYVYINYLQAKKKGFLFLNLHNMEGKEKKKEPVKRKPRKSSKKSLKPEKEERDYDYRDELYERNVTDSTPSKEKVYLEAKDRDNKMDRDVTDEVDIIEATSVRVSDWEVEKERKVAHEKPTYVDFTNKYLQQRLSAIPKWDNAERENTPFWEAIFINQLLVEARDTVDKDTRLKETIPSCKQKGQCVGTLLASDAAPSDINVPNTKILRCIATKEEVEGFLKRRIPYSTEPRDCILCHMKMFHQLLLALKYAKTCRLDSSTRVALFNVWVKKGQYSAGSVKTADDSEFYAFLGAFPKLEIEKLKWVYSVRHKLWRVDQSAMLDSVPLYDDTFRYNKLDVAIEEPEYLKDDQKEKKGGGGGGEKAKAKEENYLESLINSSSYVPNFQ